MSEVVRLHDRRPRRAGILDRLARLVSRLSHASGVVRAWEMNVSPCKNSPDVLSCLQSLFY